MEFVKMEMLSWYPHIPEKKKRNEIKPWNFVVSGHLVLNWWNSRNHRFLNKNKDQFTANSQIYHCATRQQSDFHQPTANRAKYQKGIGYIGVKVFNRLPINVKKEFDNSKKFRHSLKNFLREKSFYSLQEYFEL